jgi:hypothetical protein
MRRGFHIVAALSVVALAVSGVALAGGITSTDVQKVAFEGVEHNSCTGENIDLTGVVLVSVHETVDAAGGKHFYGKLSTQEVSGVALETGTMYRLISNRHGEENFILNGVLTGVNVGPFILVSQGSGSNLVVQGVAHITRNANGTVTVDFSMTITDCAG